MLKGVSLSVPAGGIVALLGANGAGKSTTLKAISGLLKHEDGEVTDGSIDFMGERIDRKDPEEIAEMGIIQVIEGRRVFEHLTVEENLRVGAHLRKRRVGGERRPGERLPVLSPPEAAAGSDSGIRQRGGAADDGHGAGHDGQTQADSPG